MILNFFSLRYHQQIQTGCRRGNPPRFGQAFNLTILTFNKQTVTVESSFSLCSDDSNIFFKGRLQWSPYTFPSQVKPSSAYPFTPQHQHAHSPYCFLYNSYGADKENLSINLENIQLVIISFIVMTLLCDAGVILLGELRCQSLSGLKGETSASCISHTAYGS